MFITFDHVSLPKKMFNLISLLLNNLFAQPEMVKKIICVEENVQKMSHVKHDTCAVTFFIAQLTN